MLLSPLSRFSLFYSIYYMLTALRCVCASVLASLFHIYSSCCLSLLILCCCFCYFYYCCYDEAKTKKNSTLIKWLYEQWVICNSQTHQKQSLNEHYVRAFTISVVMKQISIGGENTKRTVLLPFIYIYMYILLIKTLRGRHLAMRKATSNDIENLCAVFMFN